MENRYTIEIDMKHHFIRKSSCLDIFDLLKAKCKINGIQEDNPEITYTNSNDNAVICEEGKIKGVGKGISQITLDYHGQKETTNIYVDYEIINGQLV